MSPIYKFSQVESTNDIAKQDKFTHGDVIWSQSQSKGRGQRGNKWDSEPNKNLTFSLVLCPEMLAANEQFYLLQTTALAVLDLLTRYEIKAKLKWTNDIYVENNKICGILIDNDIYGSNLSRSVIGIGLNINQTEFQDWVPNPTSMKILLSYNLDTEQIMKELYYCLEQRYSMLEQGLKLQIAQEYHNHLYLLDTWHLYHLPSGESFEGKILGTKPNGELMVENRKGEILNFLFKEIIF